MNPAELLIFLFLWLMGIFAVIMLFKFLIDLGESTEKFIEYKKYDEDDKYQPKR